ncbi:MAG: type II toxin-antitoxin system VapC family toxin [Streptosporangiaceae bacterium]|nr:type II toxin-antitoxin system VapC family toxin [Streptosporangiaceae bacterium]
MMLVDTNVMIYAHRLDAKNHREYRDWLEAMINGPEPYTVADFAVNGMVRVVTDRRIYRERPATLEEALAFADRIRNQPHAHVISPGPRFWSIFHDLCQKTGASGKLVPDAYLAALAIEHGCEFITTDGDFGKFPGLRWRHPLN